MSNKIGGVKGMNDVWRCADEPFLDIVVWEHVLGTAARVLDGHGYRQVLLPVVEETALFTRGIGQTTDVVQKEMYTFTDRGGRQLSLRPEATAGAVRAYVEHNLAHTDPVVRWWYQGPMYRAERPQKGRYRQFYQLGAELFGVATPEADAEMLVMLDALCRELGLSGMTTRLNTLGDAESRGRYRVVLRAYLEGVRGQLCDSCVERLDTNPLRVLDCKRPECRAACAAAPDMLATLSDAARAHFERTREILGACGVRYERDPRLVRGLDYYTGIIFELVTGQLGAQDAVLGGGRYDGLVQELGGPPTPAIGFAAGIERIALLLGERFMQAASGPDLYVVPMPGTHAAAFGLAAALRAQGPWRVEVDVSAARLKHQMRRADKVGARAAIVLGDQEVRDGVGKLKRLDVSSETEVALTGEALHAALGQLLGSTTGDT